MRPLLASVALAVLTAGCASGAGVRPAPFPAGPSAPKGAARPAAEDVVRTALGLRGAPYRNGGTDPTGFDCSGLVAYVFGRHGIDVPRTVAEQSRVGVPVSGSEIRPGDLVIFRTSGSGPTHIGIAVTARTFVHAPTSRGLVRVDPLTAPYWRSRLVGVRRLTA